MTKTQATKKQKAGTLCPRCREHVLRKPLTANSLSRRDNETYICFECGAAEAMFDYSVSTFRKKLTTPEEKRRLFNLEVKEQAWLCHKAE